MAGQSSAATRVAPLAGMSALLLAHVLGIEGSSPLRVLDVAAGHGLFGITMARLNPAVQVTGLDWANVLGVAAENARLAACRRPRWQPRAPGSAHRGRARRYADPDPDAQHPPSTSDATGVPGGCSRAGCLPAPLRHREKTGASPIRRDSSRAEDRMGSAEYAVQLQAHVDAG